MKPTRRDAYRSVRQSQPDLSKPIHEYNYPLYRRREIPAYGVLRISLGCWVPLQLVQLSEPASEQAVPYMPRYGEITAFARQQDAWDFLSLQAGYRTRTEEVS